VKLIEKHPVISAGPFVPSTYFAYLNERLHGKNGFAEESKNLILIFLYSKCLTICL